MIYLICSLLGVSLYANYYLNRKSVAAAKQVETLKSEIVVLEKMYDDLSKEYSEFVDFVNDEEVRIQNEVGEKLIKSLQDEIMSEALRMMKPVYEA
jgi:hypothetical protein